MEDRILKIEQRISKPPANPLIEEARGQSSTDKPKTKSDYVQLFADKRTKQQRLDEKLKFKALEKREEVGEPASLELLLEENQRLRESIKAFQLKLSEYKSRAEPAITKALLQNARLKREEARSRVASNKYRLGEYQLESEGGGKLVWVDGYALRKVRERLNEIGIQKELIQKKRKNLQKKGEEDQSDRRGVLNSQMMMLAKEEQALGLELQNLEDQKVLFNRQYKKIYEEERSRYGKPNSLGLINWPLLNDNYQVLELIGKGGYSEVYRAFDVREVREVACKVHQLHSSWSDSSKENYIRHATRESEVHRLLQHPNIVRLFNTFNIDQNSMCTVLELCDGPDLGAYLKKVKMIPEKDAKVLIRQVLSAIKYLHTLPEKVIHYDLKPQNIMFHRGQVKVSDFGLCKIMQQESASLDLTSQGVGTYWYLPPQCFFVSDSPVKISPKVDVWSTGVIFYEMLYGKKPFGHHMSQLKILKEGVILKSTKLEFPLKPQLPPECKDFIQKCLTYNEAERPDIAQVLLHPYFERK